MGRLRIACTAIAIFALVSCGPTDLLLSIMETADPPGWELVQTLTGEAAGDQFGIYVDVTDGYAIIGANGADEGGSFRGAAYIYQLDRTDEVKPWRFQQKIGSDDASDFDVFGAKVAITPEYAAVSSQQPDWEVEIFERSGSLWNYVIEFTIPGGEFGSDIDLDGDHLVVGDKVAGNARFYYRDAGVWGLRSQVSGFAPGEFGTSVAIHNGFAVVGEPLSEVFFIAEVGLVYLYQWSPTLGWLEIDLLVPYTDIPSSIAQTFYGQSVAVHNGTIVVGATGTNTVYIYNLDQGDWSLDTTVTLDGVIAGDELGGSVTATDRMVGVGASETAGTEGAAYVIEEYGDNWKETSSFRNYAIGDRTGKSVAMYDEFLFVGSGTDDTPIGVDAGTVYIYRRPIATGITGE